MKKSEISQEDEKTSGQVKPTQESEIKTGGQLFARLLKLKNVDFVFGTTGAGMPDIQDAMVVEKPPKWIQGLHEFVTVCAASGYALASEKPGVALIDRVVGTQNAIGAFFAAYHNSAPLVVFASSNLPGVPIETGAPELHYSSFQNLMVAPWVKWSTQVNALENISDDVAKAFDMAISEHRGPVYVMLRQDLMAKQTHRSLSRIVRQTQTLSRRVPDDEALERIARELIQHEHPEIIVGNAGRHPEAVEALLEFSHFFGASVRERRFFMSYPTTDELHLGFTHRYHPPEIANDSDLVLTLELGLLPHQRFERDVEVIDMNSDPMHRQDVYAGGDYGSTTLFPTIVRASCDLAPALKKIVKIGKNILTSSDSRRVKENKERLAEMHKSLFAKWRQKSQDSFMEERLDDWSVGYVINTSLEKEPDNFVWVNGTASSYDILLRTIDTKYPATYFGNPSGHLGATVGMAYGIAMAGRTYENVQDLGTYSVGSISRSSKIVMCTTGDGDAVFGNIDSALWTCRHYGIGVLYVILNNACWGVEWPPIVESSQKWASRAKDYEFLDIDKPRIDFSKVASGFDVTSYRIETTKDLNLVLPKAIQDVKSGVPVLLDVVMDKYTGGAPSVVA